MTNETFFGELRNVSLRYDKTKTFDLIHQFFEACLISVTIEKRRTGL